MNKDNLPFASGDHTLTEMVWGGMIPIDGYPLGSRTGPRPYFYVHNTTVYIVVIDINSNGDTFVGPIMETTNKMAS